MRPLWEGALRAGGRGEGRFGAGAKVSPALAGSETYT